MGFVLLAALAAAQPQACKTLVSDAFPGQNACWALHTKLLSPKDHCGLYYMNGVGPKLDLFAACSFDAQSGHCAREPGVSEVAALGGKCATPHVPSTQASPHTRGT